MIEPDAPASPVRAPAASPPPDAPRAARRAWAIALAGMVLAAVAFFGREQVPGAGSSVALEVTVVPGDVEALDCGLEQGTAGVRCGFDLQGQPIAGDTGGRLLRPYVTREGALVLLAGVFEEPHVASWLVEARSRGSDDRVRLACQGKMLSSLGPVRFRFGAQNDWDERSRLPAATVESCRVASF
ncbi:MAG TPA: hypothetical protein VFH68_23375 [Polyangia bacterium]|jgi:hypothetical protein|nr:hypothetical protein [Polyangia bacterium]